jgi:hypothetical protein
MKMPKIVSSALRSLLLRSNDWTMPSSSTRPKRPWSTAHRVTGHVHRRASRRPIRDSHTRAWPSAHMARLKLRLVKSTTTPVSTKKTSLGLLPRDAHAVLRSATQRAAATATAVLIIAIAMSGEARLRQRILRNAFSAIMRRSRLMRRVIDRTSGYMCPSIYGLGVTIGLLRQALTLGLWTGLQ